jgi:hypothetical protein
MQIQDRHRLRTAMPSSDGEPIGMKALEFLTDSLERASPAIGL